MKLLVLCPLHQCAPKLCENRSCPASAGKEVKRGRVEAIQFIRTMRGTSKPILVKANDDQFYVVKFVGNQQGTRTLINEIVVGCILRRLHVRIPSFTTIHVSEEFISSNRCVHLESPNGSRVPVPPGIHYASRLSVNPDRVAIYDYIPTSLLKKVSNLRDFIKVLIADKWICNVDRRQAVFIRERFFAAEMIDHGMALGGNSWAFDDAPLRGVYHDCAVYDEIQSWEDLEPYILAVENFSDTDLEDSIMQIPEEWLLECSSDGVTLMQLLECLSARRGKIRGLVESLVHLPDKVVFRNLVVK